MILGVVIGPFLLKSPLADAPQVYRYTLPITELGTEIMALMSHYRFNCATIVTDSATECYEICLPHTYIFCSFALFFYPFLLFHLLIHIMDIPLKKIAYVDESGIDTYIWVCAAGSASAWISSQTKVSALWHCRCSDG